MARVQWGAFALTYGCGVALEHVPTGQDVYFQPGDDSGEFLDRFQAMQDAAPSRPIAAILAALWEEHRP